MYIYIYIYVYIYIYNHFEARREKRKTEMDGLEEAIRDLKDKVVTFLRTMLRCFERDMA